jgi:hypothetical protein
MMAVYRVCQPLCIGWLHRNKRKRNLVHGETNEHVSHEEPGHLGDTQRGNLPAIPMLVVFLTEWYVPGYLHTEYHTKTFPRKKAQPPKK